jgi:hypothetical protein
MGNTVLEYWLNPVFPFAGVDMPAAVPPGRWQYAHAPVSLDALNFIRLSARISEKNSIWKCQASRMSPSVSEIADFAGIRRSQLYRLFVQHLHGRAHRIPAGETNSTACTFFCRYRVSVSEAAYSVGFSDPL